MRQSDWRGENRGVPAIPRSLSALMTSLRRIRSMQGAAGSTQRFSPHGWHGRLVLRVTV
jgi:hypothetical protein